VSLGATTHSLAVAPQGNWVAAGGDKGRFSLLEARTLNRVWERNAGSNAIAQLEFNAAGTRLAGGTLRGMLYQWSTAMTDSNVVSLDLTQGAPQVYGRHEVHALRYHPNGAQLAIACGSGLVYLLEAGSTRVLHRLPHDDVPVFDLRFTADGKRFAVASFRGYAQVYDSQSGLPVGAKLQHDSSVMSLDFSPDGTLLLTGSDDQKARVWNLATGRILSMTQGHRNTLFRTLFSPGGERFLTSAADGSARIWETATGLPLDEPLPHGYRASTYVAWQGSQAVAILAPESQLLVYRLPSFSKPAPAWFSILSDALSGRGATNSPAGELLKLKADLNAKPTPTEWESWGKSLFAP
jgi:WD40 repeat protein